ncbi:bifunctional UDP-N-acetylglucosamine diphosphorylase/glucosamine-1-phosphate N-acetyltransferase GlmU [Galactobacter valiniphilus]|uniref:Bifunctional protein GlmU n=2 Tax=Galactobacter valiniphilus TaxID=2676122 RepID=A0A399J8S1_9MICC|nr:bifunctional UDP-N-acetylglucosamine diphosphorylase/glucosamine-1-phosphate N-acetyltransferase GlmU [Galactobacter valiniphilus]RII41973.1 bifunctional UDP-N-acetylglucosamine diphosphorylase/glucosamine-1-phosphate N-acetyltransferase GlmU [Galactobacter valiniphilus]
MSDAIHPAAVIVLAAGEGTRMKSSTPKILHRIGGRSMVGHALDAAAALEPERLAVVVRHERDRVAAHVLDHAPQIAIVDQDDVPGTGRAVEVALEALEDLTHGTVVVTYGDVPLLSAELLGELVSRHVEEGNSATVLTARVEDPTGYGRVLRAEDGSVLGIKEQKDASEEELAINEINSGIYAFSASALRGALARVGTQNAQGEKYLTDVLGIMRQDGDRVSAAVTTDQWQVEGANDRVQLSALGRELNRRIVTKWMREGVTVMDPESTWIDVDVILARDVTLLPGTLLQGHTAIGEGATVGPDTTLVDTVVGRSATVKRTDATGSRIGAGASVGPFAYLRKDTVLGEDGKIGAFYETKNVTIGARTKLSHLGYAGDAEIGEDTNIGCGNITSNYDGVNKHRTVIGSQVRTGANTVFIAPVTVGDGAYTGAGAVVRKDVPAGALAITQAPQANSEGWVQRKRPGSAAAVAAMLASQTISDASSTPLQNGK